MARRIYLYLHVLTLLLFVGLASAGWWDDLTNKVASGFESVGQWIRTDAAPTVERKFNEAKASLQDPETHRTVHDWIKERAERVSEFAQTEVLPELKKIYDAASDSGTDGNHHVERH